MINADSNPQFDSRQIEKLVVHPSTAQWLMLNGYTYEYEYTMPEYGRVDFLATHANGHKLLVECKYRTGKKSGRDLMQLVDYRRQMPHCRAAFALPKSAASEYIRDICDAYQIALILLDIDDNIQKTIKPRPRYTSLSPETFERAIQIIEQHEDCYKNAETWFQRIAEECADEGVTPFYSWLIARNENAKFYSTNVLYAANARQEIAIQIRKTWLDMMRRYAKATPETSIEMLQTIYSFEATYEADPRLCDIPYEVQVCLDILAISSDYLTSTGGGL